MGCEGARERPGNCRRSLRCWLRRAGHVLHGGPRRFRDAERRFRRVLSISSACPFRSGGVAAERPAVLDRRHRGGGVRAKGRRSRMNWIPAGAWGFTCAMFYVPFSDIWNAWSNPTTVRSSNDHSLLPLACSLPSQSLDVRAVSRRQSSGCRSVTKLRIRLGNRSHVRPGELPHVRVVTPCRSPTHTRRRGVDAGAARDLR